MRAVPDEKVMHRLSSLYQDFSLTWVKSRRGIDLAFKKTLANKPKLLAAFQYLEGAVPNQEFRRRVLRGHNPLHFTCGVCGSPMCGTKNICTNKCAKGVVARLTATTTWRLVRYKERNSRVTGATVRCSACGKVITKDLCSIRCGYSCSCQRDTKIALALREKFTHKDYLARLKERGVKVKLLSKYVNAKTDIEYECLTCGSTGSANPITIACDKFCYFCGQRKYQDRCRAKHGVPNHIQRPEVQAARKQTMLCRFGTIHALQNRELFEKMKDSSYSTKVYQLGNRLVEVQGYEPQALDWLLQNTPLRPKDIECGSSRLIPSVPYQFRGADRTYHPDIFVPSLNLIIEVKSKRTYETNVLCNAAKWRACKKAGYKFMLLLMSSDGRRLNGRKESTH